MVYVREDVYMGWIGFIGGSMGYVFAESEVRKVYVTGKHLEDGRGRRGTMLMKPPGESMARRYAPGPW